MEINIRIDEKLAALLLIGVIAITATGLSIAQSPPDPGHDFSEIECIGCIGTEEISDSAVSDIKISDVSWTKLSDIPADIANGDDVGITSESDPTVSGWAKGGSCSCGTCWATRITNCNPPTCGECISKREMCTPSGWKETSGVLRKDNCVN